MIRKKKVVAKLTDMEVEPEGSDEIFWPLSTSRVLVMLFMIG